MHTLMAQQVRSPLANANGERVHHILTQKDTDGPCECLARIHCSCECGLHFRHEYTYCAMNIVHLITVLDLGPFSICGVTPSRNDSRFPLKTDRSGARRLEAQVHYPDQCAGRYVL